MKTPLQYSPSAGTHISYACQEAIALAGDRNRPVHFSFNGTRMKVHKRLPLQHVLRQWDERTEASSRRYRNSPKGKAAAEKRTAVGADSRPSDRCRNCRKARKRVWMTGSGWPFRQPPNQILKSPVRSRLTNSSSGAGGWVSNLSRPLRCGCIFWIACMRNNTARFTRK